MAQENVDVPVPVFAESRVVVFTASYCCQRTKGIARCRRPVPLGYSFGRGCPDVVVCRELCPEIRKHRVRLGKSVRLAVQAENKAAVLLVD